MRMTENIYVYMCVYVCNLCVYILNNTPKCWAKKQQTSSVLRIRINELAETAETFKLCIRPKFSQFFPGIQRPAWL